MYWVWVCLLFGTFVFGSPSDSIFDPPDLEEKMNLSSGITQETSNTRTFGTGAIVTPILAGKDELRGIEFTRHLINNRYFQLLTVVGHAFNGSNHSIAIARYTYDGELDTAFATSGIFTSDPTASDDLIHSASVGGNGLPFNFVGRSGGSPNNMNWLVGKIKTNGSLDTTFFTSGIRIGSFFENDETFRAMNYNTSTRPVYAAGYAWWYGRYNFMVAAFTSNGALDTSFNGGLGYNLTPLSSSDNGALAIGLSTLENTVSLAGPSYNGSDWDFGFAKYLTSGTLSTSFHTDGMATYPILGSNDKNYAIARPDSTATYLYSGGFAYNGLHNDFALIRVLASGSLDTTFHTDGKVTTDIGGASDVIFGLGLINFKVYAVGSTDNGGNLDVAVARYGSNGSLDTSFHTDGYNSYDVLGGNDVGSSVTLEAYGGRIYVGARVTNGATLDFSIVSVHTDGTLAASAAPNRSFGTSGNYTIDFGGTEIFNSGYFNDYGGYPAMAVFGKSGSDAAILSLRSRGVIDTAFDTDGVKTLDLGGNEEFNGGFVDNETSMTSLAVGSTSTDFLVARYLYNRNITNFAGGTLDTSFHTDGIETIDFSGSDVAFGVTDPPFYVVVGRDGSATTNVALAKYRNIGGQNTPGGSLDTAFHTDGLVTYAPTGNSAVLKYGKSLYYAGSDTTDFIGMSITTAGTLNTSFNTSGVTTIDFGGVETLGSAFLDTTGGRLVLVGGNGSDWVIARITTAGVMDTSFHTDGKVVMDSGAPSEIATGVKVTESNNKTVVTGDNGSDLLFARFLSNGILDTSFHTDGLASLDIQGADTSKGMFMNFYGDIFITGATNGGVDALVSSVSQ